jgi:glycosyltransferase involved in cell wall biosynthesis
MHDEIPVWMDACDVFVLPSLNEGSPIVMFESLGFGKPFVGTKVGGIPEIITSEDYGLLCEPANQKELAEKILAALDKEWDDEKIRKYAEQFRTLTSNYFREHIQSECLIQIHHLLWNLSDHATPTHLKMVDLAVFE